jgi:GNAT superfamily N-acetyltransferase
VIGVYVRDDHRGLGTATKLVRALIALHRERICAAGELMAAAGLWPRYKQIAAEFGLTFAEYE